ncbi:MAG: site-specific DNA-methyltransferase, partial [Steroidobacteraceae bacterium]
MASRKKPAAPKSVEALKHDADKRRNIPTAEHQSVLDKAQQTATPVRYPRNTDLDPQLVWRGKDEQDWSDLVVHAPPLYIQEKVHPKALIDDLSRMSKQAAHEAGQLTADLFADFNGIPKGVDKTEFYQHEQNWSNRMILGDSLQVMASLAEREGLRGKVQCIYFDPPYGIKFNSNFQWSTTSRDVKDGKADHITREPEQVKAFRDTWRDGIHSYLTYLRDRLTVARDLLTESGSIFVQIGDENVHRVRALMDEVFGSENFVRLITVQKTHTAGSPSGGTTVLAGVSDYIVWYGKNSSVLKYRQLFQSREGHSWVNYDYAGFADGSSRRMSQDEKKGDTPLSESARVYRRSPLTSSSSPESARFPVSLQGREFTPGKGGWKTNAKGMARLSAAQRLESYGVTLAYRRYAEDFPLFPFVNLWTDTARGGYGETQVYVVQTSEKVLARCILMATDPGDLVFDPTCGSGTTAYVAEQWGRRWITIDTSRVALALARARIMGARYPSYLLADSAEGQLKEAEVTRSAPSTMPTYGNVRHGFVYERVPHITLKSIANNAEIDVIWDKWQAKLEPLREQLNVALKKSWQEWEIPRDA